MKCYQFLRSASLKCETLCLFIVLVFLFPASQLCAEEPAERFLEALRERGYYRAALHYLDGAGESDAVPESFRKEVLFEKAQILIDSVRGIRDPEEIGTRLDQADKLLAQQAKKVSDPLKSTEVKKIQANVRYFRGRNYLKQAESEKTPAAKKGEYFGQANKLLGAAIPKYREVQKAQQDQIENYQLDPQDPDSDKNLRKLQSSYVDTRLKIPVAMEKFGLSFGDDKEQRSAKLVAAGKEFVAVAKKYDQRFVQGQMARAFGAKCYQQAGKNNEAFKLLNAVFEYPNPPKPLIQEALNVGVGIWPELEPYPFEKVIAAAEKPVSLLSRREKSNPTWLRIQLELARAKRLKSDAIAKDNAKESKKLKSDATRLAREVARRRNPHSKMAVDLLGEWGVSAVVNPTEVKTVDVSDIKTFADAKLRSTEMIGPLSTGLSQLNKAQRQLSKLTGPKKDERALEVEELKASVKTQADQALTLLSKAVSLANDETPRADLNNIRYLQSYCHFAKGRYRNAAVIGQFLMEKYPTIDWSLQASNLMVRSYEKIFDNSTGDSRAVARDRVIDSASQMLQRWAGSDESASAAVAATRVAVIDGDFAAANRFFEKIPSGSPTRSPLASRIGQQIWSGRAKTSDDAAKAKMAESAKGFFAAAIENADAASMDVTTAVSNLYYIDACRETGDVDLAVANADTLMGVLDSNPNIKSRKIRQAVYNSSLNAYLAALGGKGKPQVWISKSKDLVSRMGKEAAGDPAAQQNVSRVYRKVATDLQNKFESLPNVNEQTKFAGSLQSFFSAIGSGAKDGRTRLWAGSALLGIAEKLKANGGDAKGKELAAEAVALLGSAKEAGFGGDEKLELNYEYQLALAQRSSGKYQEAVDSFTRLLEKKSVLNFQIDAAKTLQMWGVDKNDKNALVRAMNGMGDYKDPKTNKPRKRIWGWSALAAMTRDPKRNLREQFRECQYYKILCRLEYARVAKSVKAAKSGKSELDKAMQRFDDLAVGSWKNKYNQLLKDLESALKEL